MSMNRRRQDDEERSRTTQTFNTAKRLGIAGGGGNSNGNSDDSLINIKSTESSSSFRTIPTTNDTATTRGEVRAVDDDGGENRTVATPPPPPPQSLMVQHTVTNNRGNAGGLIFGLSKPVFTMLVSGSLLLFTSGAAAYLFSGWIEIPSLNRHIENLEAEIHRLTSQVDRLEAENDRYKELNQQLNVTVQELVEVNDNLEMTTTHLHEINALLNETNQELDDRILDLVEQNQEYATLNTQLNSTTMDLTDEVNRFRTEVAQLVLEHATIANLSSTVLESITESLLDTIGDDQDETLTALQLILTEIVSENSQLETLNSDLTTILSFWNETSMNVGDSVDQMIQFLASQITFNQMLVQQSLENTYRQRIANWDCDYRSVFFDQDFVMDYTSYLLTNDEEDLVLAYIEERVLSELCLQMVDFARYMDSTYPGGWTSNRLTNGLQTYTLAALDYYFPDQEEEGLTTQVWADASYDCDNLPDSLLYEYNPSNT